MAETGTGTGIDKDTGTDNDTDKGNSTVTVLSSGFGLGLYIPALLLVRQLRLNGLQAETEVFEDLLTDQKRSKADESRHLYHDNFAVALGSQRIPSDIRSSLDPGKTGALLDNWERSGRRRFIVLSGHWVHVLDRLTERVNGVEADLLYVDAEPSPSWKQLRKINPAYARPYREVGLYDDIAGKVNYKLDIPGRDALSYAERNGRLAVHGGGWGIGTYRQAVEELESAGYGLDIAAYRPEEIEFQPAANRGFFMNDPAWRTWMRGAAGQPVFPPFASSVAEGTEPLFEACPDYHGVFDVVRRSAAVVSKPGAGALIDSLAAATPLIMMERFGKHEEKNANIWKAGGFGMDFADWRRSGFDPALLEAMHHNLLNARGRIPDYAAEYAQGITLAR